MKEQPTAGDIWLTVFLITGSIFMFSVVAGVADDTLGGLLSGAIMAVVFSGLTALPNNKE
jgi:hypothetical protein